RNDKVRDESKARIALFHEAYTKIQIPLDIQISTDTETKSRCVDWPSSWIGEFVTLLHRNMVNVVRDKAIIFATIGQGNIKSADYLAIFVSLIVCLLYGRVTNDFGGVQNRVGVFFFLTLNLTFSVVMPSINEFPNTKKQIRRERAAGSYRPSSAFLAKVASTYPTLYLGNTLMAIPIYFIVGLSTTPTQFFTFMLIIYLQSFVANNFGLLISSAVPSVQVGQIITPLCLLIFMLFGGVLLNIDKVPEFLRWIQYISMITYTTKALNQNEFNGMKFDCVPGIPCYKTGEDVIKAFAYENPGLWNCIIINFAIGLFFMIVALFVFARTSAPLMRLK
ncbi:ATP-binding cassette sub- G member 2, partial [Globomyces sp. JEL0801]